MLIKFKKIRHILPIMFLAAAFLALVFFGLSRINRALAVAVPGSWLQTTDSTNQGGFNFTGSVSTSTATNVVNKNGGEVELLPIGAMPNIGYAVDTNGNIQKTINKGSTWNIIKSRGVTSYYYDVFFLNENIGWAIESNGSISKTYNGGNTWATQTSGVATLLRDIFFIDANNGWIVGDINGILRTVNGGSTWTLQPHGAGSIALYALSFVNGNIGWAVGSSGVILKTTDGGLTWSQQTSGATQSILDASFINENIGWISGSEGVFIRMQEHFFS